MNPTVAWLLVVILWAFLWFRLKSLDTGTALLYGSIAFFGWLVLVPCVLPASSLPIAPSSSWTLVERFTGVQVVNGTFDGTRYREHYPDLREMDWSDEQALRHYAEKGTREGRIAFLKDHPHGGYWDDAGYLALHKDVEEEIDTDLEDEDVPPGQAHFSRLGWKQHRRISLRIIGSHSPAPAPAPAPAIAPTSAPGTSAAEHGPAFYQAIQKQARPRRAGDSDEDTLYHAALHPPHGALWREEGGGAFTYTPGSFLSGDPRAFLAAGEAYTLELWVRRGTTGGTLLQIHTTKESFVVRGTQAGWSLTGGVDVPAQADEWVHLALVRKMNGKGEVYRQGMRLTSVEGLPRAADIRSWTLLGPEVAEGAEGAAGTGPSVARVLLHRGAIAAVHLLESYLSTARRFGTMGDPDRKAPRTRLVMELDAGVHASYPGKGPVWYDLHWFDPEQSSSALLTIGTGGEEKDETRRPRLEVLKGLSSYNSPYSVFSRKVVDKLLHLSKS